MKVLHRINESLSQVFFYLTAVNTLIMLTIIFCNVIARYIFNSPFHWAEESTSIMVILIGFFPAAALLHNGWHVKFDLVSVKLEARLPRLAKASKILIHFCGVAFSCVIAWQVWINVAKSWKFNMREPSLLGTPLWVPYSFMFIGSMLLLLGFICLSLDDILGNSKEPGK